MRSVEHELIGWALNETAGNRSAAARLLKMPRNTLLRRMRVLKLQRTKRKRRRTKQY
jgi:DNA-binding NtrC family response regulator